jgi:acyl carrier protein
MHAVGGLKPPKGNKIRPLTKGRDMSTLSKVQEVIADALYVETEEVLPEALLMDDLGAESIDFLDIMFRLEKDFSIKIPKGDIEKKARGTLSDDEYATNGRLSEAALEQLRAVMPEIAPTNIKTGLMVRDIASLFNVNTFVRMVDEQLQGAVAPIANVEAPSASL